MYRLGLLACDFVPEELRDRFEDYPVMFASAIESASVEVQWQVYRTYAGEIPSSPDECDGYITTGSRNGAYDEQAWIAALEDFIRQLVESRQPLVGVCFGHQIIAEALGGKVEKSDRGWGIGVRRYEVLNGLQRRWLDPALAEFNVPVCHQDQVTRLPVGAQRLASSAHCENFMVLFNETMLGFQGHPEFSHDYIEVLLNLREKLVTGAVRDAAIRSLDEQGDNVKIMHWITNFLGIK